MGVRERSHFSFDVFTHERVICEQESFDSHVCAQICSFINLEDRDQRLEREKRLFYFVFCRLGRGAQAGRYLAKVAFSYAVPQNDIFKVKLPFTRHLFNSSLTLLSLYVFVAPPRGLVSSPKRTSLLAAFASSSSTSQEGGSEKESLV